MKKYLRNAVLAGVLYALLILLLTNVDRAVAGPKGTVVGLSHINVLFHNMTGFIPFWYNLTEVLGVVCLLFAIGLAATGLVQLFRRRDIFMMDREFLFLGTLYILTLIIYIIFERACINYRPMLLPGDRFPESSFPSTHTLLSMTVYGSAMILIGRLVSNRILAKTARIICLVLCILTVGGRLLSGVHWFTDILGGILLGLTLVNLYGLACQMSGGSGQDEAQEEEAIPEGGQNPEEVND
ncbi:MAG: phosphatase PAP2 family protein [Eubacterium sp.]|nr:phosphatase PAP2 family protein [Eubacterium sp.]